MKQKTEDNAIMTDAMNETKQDVRKPVSTNKAIGRTWDEFEKEIYTPEEIKESDERVARLIAQIDRAKLSNEELNAHQDVAHLNEGENTIKTWIVRENDGFIEALCPACGISAREDEYTGQPILSNFCPECGEDLRNERKTQSQKQ